jgi:hypothetical protein
VGLRIEEIQCMPLWGVKHRVYTKAIKIRTSILSCFSGVWIGFIDHFELHFTDHLCTQTSVPSLLMSPLAVSWQQI